jgi:hypothetical protein
MRFTHRDTRLAEIDNALEALDAAIRATTGLEGGAERLRELRNLRPGLERQREALAPNRFQTSDEYAEALVRTIAAELPDALNTALRVDPVAAADRATRPLARRGDVPILLATPILRRPAPPPGGTTTGILLGHFVTTDLPRRISPFHEVGVMLPLRLETIFEQDDDGRWTLLLRILPDEASVRRDRPTMSVKEFGFLAEFWARSKDPLPETGLPEDWLRSPHGTAAFADLAARVTAPRAAYLVGAFKPRVEDGFFVLDEPAGQIGEPERDRIAGLPQELFVTIEDENAGRVTIGSLVPNLPEEEFGVPRDEAAFESWMFSWKRARDVGMGGEFLLPDGVAPDTLRTLYVCGIGDEHPGDLFAGHANSGELALMRLGSPTNAIQGAPAADLGNDPEAWPAIAASRLAGAQAAGAQRLSRALAGRDDVLPFIAGGSNDIEDGLLIAGALWPALWGHWLRDIWKALDGWLPCWRWGLDYVRPEGCFLPLRVGAQPYGVLPVTSYDGWEASGNTITDAVERLIVRTVSNALPDWVAAGNTAGTIVGADTEGLLDRLARGGVSANYMYRTFLDASRLANAYDDPAGFEERARETWRDASRAIADTTPERRYLAIGEPRLLRLPLVNSDRLFPLDMSFEKLLDTLYTLETEDFAGTLYSEKILHRIVPRSLMARLMIHSVLLAKAWYMQEVNNDNTALLNPEEFDATFLTTKIEQFQVGFPGTFGSGQGGQELREFVELHRKACHELASKLDPGLSKQMDPLRPDGDAIMALQLGAEVLEPMERQLRAALDCAGYRLDPYATAVPYRRVLDHSASDKARHRLGAYGWLDGPFIGKPGPTRSGRLHTPSQAQTLTGIVLRDKYLTSQKELVGARNIWDMDLSSSVVRAAIEIAEELRMGLHYYEVVGRRVEGIVGSPERIRILRNKKPLRTAGDGRDSCHGPDALAALLGEGIAGVLSEDGETQGKQKLALEDLKAALEAYADLTVAEGVYQVVTGNPARAADAADAGAGLGRTPAFEFMRTPPSGYRLGTSVLAVVPFVAAGGRLPVERADASVAAFLAGRFADASQFAWVATWGPAGEQSATMTLAELGIAPLEALTMADDFLADAVRSRIGQPSARMDAPARLKLMRMLAGTLGTPADLSDVSRLDNLPDAPQRANVEKLRADLADRYSNLRTALQDLLSEAANAPNDAVRKAWLRSTLPWGFTGSEAGKLGAPLSDLLFGNLPPGADEQAVIAALVTAASDALAARLKRVTEEVKPGEVHQPPALARAITELVIPGGRLPLMSHWSVADVKQASGLTAAAPLGAADSPWLSPLATVRPPLARLEAVQLQASHLGHMAALSAHANTGDLWRTDAIAANAELRRKNMAEREAADQPKLDLSRLVVAYGPPDAWTSGEVAVSVIDEFTEAVPMRERTSTVGFGFNAPASRPPQAILLAVPPNTNQSLDEAVLLDILADTRKLLRARAARPEHVGNQGLMSATWLDAASPLQVRLDAGSQYHR